MNITDIQNQICSYILAGSNSIGGADIVAVSLFGSIARGTASTESDLDIGILLSSKPTITLEGTGQVMASALSKLLKKNVDLVILNDASPDFVHRVLKDGAIIYDADRSKRINFEVQKRNEYFDILPIIKQYRLIPT